MKMSLSKSNIIKRGAAWSLALVLLISSADFVCAAETEGAQADTVGAQEPDKSTDIEEAQEPDKSAEVKEPEISGKEEEPESVQKEAAAGKQVRRLETEKEITKLCGEVFTIDVELVDETESKEEKAPEKETEAGEAEEDGVLAAQSGKEDETPAAQSREDGVMAVQSGKEEDETPAAQSGKEEDGTKDGLGTEPQEDKSEATEAEKEERGDKPEEDAEGTAEAEREKNEEPLQYESSNPEIVSVEQRESGNPQIRAAAEGDAVITVTAPETEQYEKAQVQVLVHVAASKTAAGPETPEDISLTEMSILPASSLTAIENVAGGISLKWRKIEGAGGYYLEKSTTGRAPWNKVKITKGADAVTFVDRQVEEGAAYYYRVRAYEASGKEGLTGASKKITYLAAPVFSVGLSSAGTELKWNRVTGCKGYYVYRRETSQKNWTKAAEITQPGEISWRDTAAGNGITYIYSVRAYRGSSVSPYAGGKSYVRVGAPSVKSFKRKSSTKYKLTWKTNPSASGYQIQYAQNGMFVGAKKATVKKAKTSSYTLSRLAKKKNYYARIRAYKKVGGTTYYSSWSEAGNVKKTRTAKASLLSKKKKVFEIRKWADQKMFQYDTLQGSCTDGTYAYYLLFNRKVSKCKIVKVKRSNLKVVQVSGALDVAHGNDMTYDSHRKRLVIVHSTGVDPKRLTSVDPQSLGIIESKHVQIPKKLAGGSIADANGATAFSGVAYSSGRKQYVVLLSHNYNFVILDSDLEPVRYVKAGKKYNYVMQGIDATDDYIMVAQSPKTSKQKYNIITVYDWDGRYISKINVKKGYEIESIYHVGSKYYAGFYRSYYKTRYKNVIKKVKVKGKEKKKKVKVKYREYQRDNYVYQIKGI